METEKIVIDLEGGGRLSGLFARPPRARAVYVFAHGAGADMSHIFMEEVAMALAQRGVASLRFNFPFMEARNGKRWARPDQPAVAHAAIRAAIRRARAEAPELPLFAGGKSFGARMTSQMFAQEPLAQGPIAGVRGLVFLGFPLHLAKKPSIARGEHLAGVAKPMLFVQGSRDALADASLLQDVCSSLPGAMLHFVEGADHGFDVLVRSGRTHAQVVCEIADSAAGWIDAQLQSQRSGPQDGQAS